MVRIESNVKKYFIVQKNNHKLFFMIALDAQKHTEKLIKHLFLTSFQNP